MWGDGGWIKTDFRLTSEGNTKNSEIRKLSKYESEKNVCNAAPDLLQDCAGQSFELFMRLERERERARKRKREKEQEEE